MVARKAEHSAGQWAEQTGEQRVAQKAAELVVWMAGLMAEHWAGNSAEQRAAWTAAQWAARSVGLRVEH